MLLLLLLLRLAPLWAKDASIPLLLHRDGCWVCAARSCTAIRRCPRLARLLRVLLLSLQLLAHARRLGLLLLHGHAAAAQQGGCCGRRRALWRRQQGRELGPVLLLQALERRGGVLLLGRVRLCGSAPWGRGEGQ